MIMTNLNLKKELLKKLKFYHLTIDDIESIITADGVVKTSKPEYEELLETISLDAQFTVFLPNNCIIERNINNDQEPFDIVIPTPYNNDLNDFIKQNPQAIALQTMYLIEKERREIIKNESQFLQNYIIEVLKYMLTQGTNTFIMLTGKNPNDRCATVEIYSTSRRVKTQEIENIANTIYSNFEQNYTYKLHDELNNRGIILYLNSDFDSCNNIIQNLMNIFEYKKTHMKITKSDDDTSCNFRIKLPYQ